MKPAARVQDMHTCPMVEGMKPHVGGSILMGTNHGVLIGGLLAGRIGDKAQCVGPIDTINSGSKSVLIAGKSACRIGDTTSHGGIIATGYSSVLIGD